MLKAPILGMVLRKIAVARFCRTLGTLLSAGVPVLESLEITARTSGNAVIEEAILEVRKAGRGGQDDRRAAQGDRAVPADGRADDLRRRGHRRHGHHARKIAEFYEDEVDVAVAGMMKLIEPVMILFLGVVIGGIVIAMYLPMFDLISKIG